MLREERKQEPGLGVRRREVINQEKERGCTTMDHMMMHCVGVCVDHMCIVWDTCVDHMCIVWDTCVDHMCIVWDACKFTGQFHCR